MEDRFRVYDYINGKWVEDEVLISRLGDMHRIKKAVFGKEHIELMSDTQYVYQMNTLSMDMYGNNVFEGDICKVKDSDIDVTGIIIYNGMTASYQLFCDDGSYYALSPTFTAHMSIVGNTFDNQDVLENILMNVDNT